MRTTLLASAAAVALMLGAGGASAQSSDTQPGAQPAAPAEQDSLERQDAPATPGGETTAPPGADTTTPGAVVTPGALAPSEGQSFVENQDSFTGSIAGGLNADQLVGQKVVTADGDELGEINDLLIGPDGTVTHAMVATGGFLGIGKKNVAVELAGLQPSADGAVVAEISQDELEAQPRYEKVEGRWMQAASAPAEGEEPAPSPGLGGAAPPAGGQTDGSGTPGSQ